MALRYTVRYCLECSNYRLLRRAHLAKQSYKFYSSNFKEEIQNDAPIKYSETAASRLTAAQNLKLHVNKEPELWYKKYVILASLCCFIAYFCIFREENDIDEIIKGNSLYTTDHSKYIDLKIKLSYCEKNKLPTEALKAKLEELEKKLGRV